MTNDSTKKLKTSGALCEAVTAAMENYFDHLEDEQTTDLYQLVLGEVEAPLLRVVMERTKQNQSTASQILGINRGTLRKKLKEYKLI